MPTGLKDRLDQLVTVAMALAAIAMVWLFLAREFGASSRVASSGSSGEPVYVENWRTHLASGIVRGRVDAPITIVELMDFECPFCQRMDSVLEQVRQRFDTSIAVVFIHFPLPNHRFAIPAATAAECGLAQGRFEQLQTVLFAKQDSFGLKPWRSYAAEAGIPDLNEFTRCTASARELTRIKAGLEVGRAMGLRGTPTILLNGWRFPIPPTFVELESAITESLSGRGKWAERNRVAANR